MAKRSTENPYRKNETEQRMVNQRFYGKLENEPSRINPIFLKVPDYGVKKGAVK